MYVSRQRKRVISLRGGTRRALTVGAALALAAPLRVFGAAGLATRPAAWRVKKKRACGALRGGTKERGGKQFRERELEIRRFVYHKKVARTEICLLRGVQRRNTNTQKKISGLKKKKGLTALRRFAPLVRRSLPPWAVHLPEGPQLFLAQPVG
jgi:hypothetical protein